MNEERLFLPVETKDGSLSLENQNSRELNEYIAYANRVAEELKNLKSFIENEMRKLYFEKGQTKIESEYLNIAFIPASVVTKFDEKKFKEENPALYNKYLKQSDKKESVRITLKEIKEEEIDDIF